MGIGAHCCRRCGEDIIGKGPLARVCEPCQKKNRRDKIAIWTKNNPRLEYHRQYYLDHKEEHNKRSRAYMKSVDPVMRRQKNREWWKENALAQKVKRTLGLKTLNEARALINQGSR